MCPVQDKDLNRLFLAIPPNELMRKMAIHAQKIPDLNSHDIRWTPPENLHLTLAFLGKITQKQYQDLLNQLTIVYPTIEPFYLKFAGVNWFPNPNESHILVAEPQPNKALLEIAHITAECCKKAGISIDSRPYRPHVALAKAKTTLPHFSLKTIVCESTILIVDEIDLYQSIEHIYTPLVRFRLEDKPDRS